ncbi:MAG: DUF4920 domain-containing protein [Bacteroidetes bacterium]|nr:DUF4920 domain-containing protein [Bacteroidota bacterium]
MKKLGFLLLGVVLFAACKQTPKTGNFGETITGDGAVAVNDFIASMGDQPEMQGKIVGTVQQVCQAEGCWYKYDLGDGKTMMVITKDHAFQLPKDCSGKTAIAEGRMYWKETSVDELKHYAVDAKKSQEEIDAITEPKRELRFEATGIIIQ